MVVGASRPHNLCSEPACSSAAPQSPRVGFGVATYKSAGGDCRLHVFENSEHEWVAKPGPQTDRAHAMVKAFIAEQVAAGRRAG